MAPSIRERLERVGYEYDPAYNRYWLPHPDYPKYDRMLWAVADLNSLSQLSEENLEIAIARLCKHVANCKSYTLLVKERGKRERSVFP